MFLQSFRPAALLVGSRGLIAVASRLTRNFSTTEEDDIVSDRFKNTRIINLNRPPALNSLNLNMVRILTPLLKNTDADPDEKLIVVQGVGGKAFCAGGDIKAIYEGGKAGNSIPKEFFSEEYRLNYLISKLTTPYVSLLNGITMGGGIGISVHGKYRLATDNTVAAMPEAAIGFFCDVGGSYFLPRLPGSLGMFLALTGHRLKGYDVFESGIATHFIPQQKWDEFRFALASPKSYDPEAIDKLIQSYSVPHTPERSSIPWKFVEHHFSHDSVESILSSLKKDSSHKAEEIYKKMTEQSSPTSLRVIFEQLKRGKNLSLKDCLIMEYRLASEFMKQPDFFTGVASVLKIKPFTHPPQWAPLASAGGIERYFAPLPAGEDLTL